MKLRKLDVWHHMVSERKIYAQTIPKRKRPWISTISTKIDTKHWMAHALSHAPTLASDSSKHLLLNGMWNQAFWCWILMKGFSKLSVTTLMMISHFLLVLVIQVCPNFARLSKKVNDWTNDKFVSGLSKSSMTKHFIHSHTNTPRE